MQASIVHTSAASWHARVTVGLLAYVFTHVPSSLDACTMQLGSKGPSPRTGAGH